MYVMQCDGWNFHFGFFVSVLVSASFCRRLQLLQFCGQEQILDFVQQVTQYSRHSPYCGLRCRLARLFLGCFINTHSHIICKVRLQPNKLDQTFSQTIIGTAPRNTNILVRNYLDNTFQLLYLIAKTRISFAVSPRYFTCINVNRNCDWCRVGQFNHTVLDYFSLSHGLFVGN